MKLNTEKTNAILQLICFLLILLWIYTAMSKLMDLNDFKRQLYNQTFGRNLANLLIWLLPIGEIVMALLLCFTKTRLIGMFLSFGAMLVFTAYIGLVLINYFGRTPCACGGVLRELGWQAHLWFNLFFLFLAGIGIWLSLHLETRGRS